MVVKDVHPMEAIRRQLNDRNAGLMKSYQNLDFRNAREIADHRQLIQVIKNEHTNMKLMIQAISLALEINAKRWPKQ